jgi:HEAT repeat protein
MPASQTTCTFLLFLWDAASLVSAKDPERDLTAAELESLWSDLAGSDAAKAHRAIWSMVDAPGSSVAFLKARLPVLEAEPARIAKLLADLDAESFGVRKKANVELEKLGESAVPALRERLEGEVTPEIRRRVETLLAAQEAKQLRAVRALEVLENIRTEKAKKVLQKIGTGAPGLTLTQEAKTSLERLTKRP